MSRRRRSRPLSNAQPASAPAPTRTLSDSEQFVWMRQDLTRLASVLAVLLLVLGAAAYWQYVSPLPHTIADSLARFLQF